MKTLEENLRELETAARGIERARCQRIAIQIRDFELQNQSLPVATRQHCAATAARIAALIESAQQA
jgi:hypothetical protein